MILTGVVMAIHWSSFFQSIQTSSVAIGTITFSTFPLFLTFLEPLLFHEKISWQEYFECIDPSAGSIDHDSGVFSGE
ncbi:MAG: EamA family transporter [Dorea longicatena]